MLNQFGVYPTMITPFLKNGEVDLDTAEKYVDRYFESGCSGIFAICQSSEIFYLSLAERVALNRRVYRRAKALEAAHGRAFSVVSSGHISTAIEDQIAELNAIWESGTDALILITNRLDPDNLGDDVFIANAEKLLAALPSDVKLGFYECPYPYKRLVTPRILEWCLQTGKFYFMKDTCCDIDVIKERLALLDGSHFKLLNANCQTLLASLQAGCTGYCGIMANFHPRPYVWLCENYESHPEESEKLQGILGTFGFTEAGLPYPLTAKYHMTLCGIPTEDIARCRPNEALTDYARDCVRQMKLATDTIEAAL